MKLLAIVLIAITGATAGAEDGAGPQAVAIPPRMPEGGRLPSYKIVAGGQEAGRLQGDAVLSNGRFFGIRWIASGNPGWRVEVKDGDPNTLYVWTTSSVQLVQE